VIPNKYIGESDEIQNVPFGQSDKTDNNRKEVIKMPNKDKTGPKGQGPKDGHGEGKGKGIGKGIGKGNGLGQGKMTGGKKGIKEKAKK